jgi:hypothetical protein
MLFNTLMLVIVYIYKGINYFKCKQQGKVLSYHKIFS